MELTKISYTPSDIRKILIIKMRYIGDTVLTTPLVKALKAGIPGARVDILVNRDTAPVLRAHPLIGRIREFDYKTAKNKPGDALRLIKKTRDARYDIVIDLTNNDRSSLFTGTSGAPIRIGYFSDHVLRRKLAYTHVIPSVLGTVHTADHHLRVAEALGLPVTDRHPFLTVPAERTRQVAETLAAEGMGNGPYAVIHPGARRWYKSWPAERFARLADAIITDYGIRVILSGSPADRKTCATILSHMKKNALNLAGRFSLAELPALIQKSRCLIGNDSAPIHIATALKTPAIALFGPTHWEAWQPRRDQDRVIAAEYPCRPCGHSRQDCPLGQNYCMGSISFESVREAAEVVLNPLSSERTSENGI